MANEVQQRQSSLGVLGLGFGLLLVAGAAFSLAAMRKPIERLSPDELLEERFKSVGTLPFGFRPVGAERDSMQRVVLRLDGDRAEEVGALDVVPGASEGADHDADESSSAESGSKGRIDWDAMTVRADDLPPARGALVWYRRDRAEEVLRDLFTSLRFESGKRGGMRRSHGGGGHGGKSKKPEAPDPKLQDAGTIEWAGYSAPYIRLREFELVDGQPLFHESVRVNLTVGPWCCVLFLRWPDGETGSRARTLEVLRAFEPTSSTTATNEAPPAD